MSLNKFKSISIITIFCMILNLFVYIPAMASDTRSISGYIWYDANGNGKWESGNKHEYVIPNVSVQLYNANGNKIIKETTSDSSGYYCFSELSKSSYYKVKVILPSGYDFTELGKGNGNGVEDRLTKIDPETGFTEAIQPDNANINVGLIRGSSTSGTGGDSTKEDLLDVSRSVGTERLKKGDTFDAKYTITPKAIPAQKDNGEKDIVLVIDTSISMNYIPTQNRYPYYYNEKSRLQIIKEVANEFVNRFENNSKVNIGLVYYNKVAKTKVTLLNMGNDSSQYVLNSSINALKTDSNTNIGDGLRAAYYMLNEDNGHEKYIILMTDGYANTYSIDSHGNYYMGSSSNYWYDCNGNTDSKGLEYAKKVASEKIAPSGIKSFIVGFSSEANASNKQIAEAAGGNYQQAVSETAVTNVYNQIQKKIESTIYGTASFQETFNENLEVVNTGTLPSGLNVSGNKVIGSFNIEYNLNSSKTEFSAKPVSFTVRYRVKDNSVSVLGSGGNSSFGKITVANNTQIKYLEEKSIDTILQNGEYMDISRNISDESVNVGDTFSAEYNITPKPLPVTKDNTEKDIVLVIDTSGSMDEKVDRIRKIETMKKVAKNFIDKFKESKNFNIGLVEYSSYACKVSDILPASSNSEILKNKIDSLEIGGATNIGDGIRTAKAMLDERTSVKEKYIILMTDGEATAYSRDKNGNKKEETQYWWKYEYYKYYKYLDDYFGTTINSSIDHGAASGGDTYDGDTYITYNGVQNTTDANALSYAKNVVDNMIKSDDSVKQFIVVGLGSDASSSNAEIVNEAGGYYDSSKKYVEKGQYYSANDTDTLERLYNQFAENIISKIHGTVDFQETFNDNLEVLGTLPYGLKASENKLSGTIDIEYALNEAKTEYEAKPISFKINYKAKSYGDGILADKENSSFATMNISSYSETKYLDRRVIELKDGTPPTAPSINCAEGWVNAPTKINIIPGEDKESGVDRTEYKLDGLVDEDWTVYHGEFYVNNEGETVVSARTIDKEENISKVSQKTIKIDMTPPTSPQITWNADNSKITIAPGVDLLSGVKKTEYSIVANGVTITDWTLYTTPVTLTHISKAAVRARTIDNAGNVSDLAEIEIQGNKPEVNIKIRDASGIKDEYKVDMNNSIQRVDKLLDPEIRLQGESYADISFKSQEADMFQYKIVKYNGEPNELNLDNITDWGTLTSQHQELNNGVSNTWVGNTNVKIPEESGSYYIVYRAGKGETSGNVSQIRREGIYGPFIVDQKADLKLSRKVNSPDLLVGNEIEIQHTITPTPFDVSSVYPNGVENAPQTYINTVNELVYEDTLPSGLTPIAKNSSTMVNGQKISVKLADSIVYKKQGNKYVSDPITFSIFIKINESKKYMLDGEKAVLTYRDIDGAVRHQNFPTIEFTASERIKSELINHGLFIGGSKPYVKEGKSFSAVKGIRQNLAFTIDVKNDNTKVKWTLDTLIDNEAAKIYIYELDDFNKTKLLFGKDTTIQTMNSEINKFKFENGKRYIIVCSFIPVINSSKDETIKSKVEIDDVLSDKQLEIKVVPLPKLN